MQNLEENAAVVPEDEAAAEESLPAAAAREGNGRPAERSPQLEAAFAQELAEIAGLDPEMTDVRAILRSDAGPKFREYVRKGLTFVEAFRLAAADRLEALRDAKAAEALRDARAAEAARMRSAGKGHLSATRSQGQGALPVPGEVKEMFRVFFPDASDAEIQNMYNEDRKRLGK